MALRYFPNAQIRMAQQESDFWLSKELQAKAPPALQKFFSLAQAASRPYRETGRWRPLNDEASVVPGVRAIAIEGHTPGHTGYEFTSKGQVLLVWGDVVHAEPVQLPHPEITIAFDADPAASARTRIELFKLVANSSTFIAGPHMPFPAIGHLRETDGAYRWVPVPYLGKP